MQESPIVTVLDADIQEKQTHCSFCLRQIDAGMAIKPDDHPLKAVYCSKKCQLHSRIQTDNFLFGSENPLPIQMSPPEGTPGLDQEQRKAARDVFLKHLHDSKAASPLLVAHFVAMHVSIETFKLAPQDAHQRQAILLWVRVWVRFQLGYLFLKVYLREWDLLMLYPVLSHR